MQVEFLEDSEATSLVRFCLHHSYISIDVTVYFSDTIECLNPDSLNAVTELEKY